MGSENQVECFHVREGKLSSPNKKYQKTNDERPQIKSLYKEGSNWFLLAVYQAARCAHSSGQTKPKFLGCIYLKIEMFSRKDPIICCEECKTSFHFVFVNWNFSRFYLSQDSNPGHAPSA